LSFAIQNFMKCQQILQNFVIFWQNFVIFWQNFVSTMGKIASQNYVVCSVADPDDFLPDPDPTFENVRIRILTLINFRTIFFTKFFLAKICSKKYEKVEQQRFLKYFWILHTPKELM
jgi:hypothetical protein